MSIQRRGLVTLERARLSIGESSTPGIGLGETAKLTVYVGRGHRTGGVDAVRAVCELLHRRGLAGATVLSASSGTHNGQRTRASLAAGNTHVPMMILFVGATGQITSVLPELGAPGSSDDARAGPHLQARRSAAGRRPTGAGRR